MKPDGLIKLVSELIDLPLIDSEGRYCGVVDDVEFEGDAGKALRPTVLLVGPGAYSGRMPGWAMALVRLVAGSRITRVPFSKIRTIGSAVELAVSGEAVGLNKTEDRAERWIPHKGAL
jgi:sporulation protein YlmC with PRC-barrel domain